MFDYIEQYQAGVFHSTPPLEPTSDNIARLMKVFDDAGFIPTTAVEMQMQFHLQPAIMPIMSPRPRNQLQMITPDRAWTIAFETTRVMITRVNLEGVTMPSRVEFIKDSTEYLNSIIAEFGIVGTRSVLAQKGLLPEMDEADLQKLRSRLYRLPSYFDEGPTAEWTTRFVARPTVLVAEKDEILNVILDLNRIKGQLNLAGSIQLIDRFQVAFDINTFQDNMTPRFNALQVSSFMGEANRIADKILTELRDLLSE